MQVSSQQEIISLIIVSTAIFLLAPLFLLIYINSYNRRKKLHIEEKETMQLQFESELLKTQLEVQEQTMQTIAADLHDNIGQLLSLTMLTLGSISLDNSEKAEEKIQTSQDLIRSSIKEMRQLAKLMHGEQLMETGLTESIRKQLDWLEKSGNYHVSFETGIKPLLVSSPQKDLILFRLVQETLNNIIKHAAASQITVLLTYEDNVLTLRIADNGKGFDEQETQVNHLGMGLANVKKRSSLIGAETTIESSPGTGTAITVNLPYP